MENQEINIEQQIQQEKKMNPKSTKWKYLTVLYVSNSFSLEELPIKHMFFEGKFQHVFTKLDITFEAFKQYVDDIKDSDIYDQASKYIEYITPILRDEEIKFLEDRISKGEMTEDEKKHNRNEKLNKTLTKVLIVVAITAIIYVIFTLLFLGKIVKF